jgi:hypothetical protein
MATLALSTIVDAGTEPTYVAASAADLAPIGSGHNTFVAYKNTDANIKTLTITSYDVSDNGDTQSPHVVSLPATTGFVKIPLRKSYDDGTGYAHIAVTGTGGVTGVSVYVAVVN